MGFLLQWLLDASFEEVTTPPPLLYFRSFKRYISSHGASIQKTKRFLERESSRLVERQAALKKAQSGSSLVPNQEGALPEDILRSLQQVRYAAKNKRLCHASPNFRGRMVCFSLHLRQEAETLMERQQTVQRGNSLLQKQEEQLQELINSVAEELGENVSRRRVCVTGL